MVNREQAELLTFPSQDALVRAVAREWLGVLEAARYSAPPFHVALSGGRVAPALYQRLVECASDCRESLARVHYWWADERCVPPDHPESNFLLAHSHLLTPLQVDPGRIHRIRGEEIPGAAAQEATREMLASVPVAGDGRPELDLVFLGMGEDGHVASLFPGEPVEVRQPPVIYKAVTVVKPPPRRITLSYQVLWAARHAWVLVSGPNKEEALARSIAEDGDTPLARVLTGRTGTRVFAALE